MTAGADLQPHVQLYRTVRSAHLERARALGGVTILHRSRRYDFDPALADGVDLVAAGPWRAALLLLRSRVTTLEVNEPLMLSAAPTTLVAVAASRLGAALRGRRLRVVAYAIENRDPAPPAAGARGRWRRARARALAGAVARCLDRIAYGTPGSQDLHLRLLARQLRRAEQRLVTTVPAPCSCAGARGPVRPGSVAFVGALEERKGFDVLARAWPAVVAARPGSTLTIIGSGRLEGTARELASATTGVDLVVDPPRSVVHEVLGGAAVLVLLSRQTPRWREQVGLPLLEGLADGCAVVTTADTGIAPWLAEHGHTVLDPGAGPHAAAAALVAVLDAARTPASVLADLPGDDGRAAAAAWLRRG